jgi:hypothetical protein
VRIVISWRIRTTASKKKKDEQQRPTNAKGATWETWPVLNQREEQKPQQKPEAYNRVKQSARRDKRTKKADRGGGLVA